MNWNLRTVFRSNKFLFGFYLGYFIIYLSELLTDLTRENLKTFIYFLIFLTICVILLILVEEKQFASSGKKEK